MGLSKEQRKFVEDFILRRPIGATGPEFDATALPDRVNQRLEILKHLAGIGMLPEGLPDEQKACRELADQVRASLGEETPSHDDLKDAQDALNKLTDHAEDVRQDIVRVRKPRFEKGKLALGALAAVAIDLPEQCPVDEKQALIKEHGDLTALLAPMRDWAQITKWDAEDLISITARTDKLSREVKTLRQDVELAVAAFGVGD